MRAHRFDGEEQEDPDRGAADGARRVVEDKELREDVEEGRER